VTRRYQLGLIFALAVLVFVVGLGRRDIIASHEARVAQTAREMAESGWPWGAAAVWVRPLYVVRPQGMVRLEPREGEPPIAVNPWMIPIFNGQVRLQKPPLPYWCAAIVFRIAGETPWGARIVPAVMGLVATFLMYDLARLLMGRRAAWAAGMVWVSSYFVPQEYRKAMADPYLAFFTLGCVWGWVKGSGVGGQGSGGEGLRVRGQGLGKYVLLFYVSLLGGLLAKGPVIFVHLGIALGAFHFFYRRRVPGRVGVHLIGVLVVLGLGLPWPVYVLRNVPGAVELWRYESVGELADNVENAREWWFYWPDLLFLAVPWTPVWLAGLGWPRVRRRRRLWFPVAWYLLTVVFFSFSNLKKDAYLLPVMPAMVLMVTQVIVGMTAWTRRRRRGWAEVLWKVQGALVVVLAAVLVFLLIVKGPDRGTIREFLKFFRHFHAGSFESSAGNIAAAVVAVVVAVAAVVLERSGGVRLRLAGLAGAYAVLFAMLVQFYMTPKDNGNSPRPLAAAMVREASAPGCTLFDLNLPDPVRFYLPRGVKYDPGARCVIVAVENRKRKSLPAVFQGRMESVERVVPNESAEADDLAIFRVRLNPPGASPTNSPSASP